jgi:hypothetical protein
MEKRQARAQWAMTLTKYCAPIRDTPVDQIDTQGVLRVLTPLWTETPETASRLRGRIEAVLNRARALGLIDENRANPARCKGHLDQLLPNPKKVGQRRRHHTAMPYANVPAFMATLKAAPGAAPRAFMFAILCAAARSTTAGLTACALTSSSACSPITSSGGRGDELAALGRALGRRLRVTTDDEPLAGVVVRGDFRHVALVEQRPPGS